MSVNDFSPLTEKFALDTGVIRRFEAAEGRKAGMVLVTKSPLARCLHGVVCKQYQLGNMSTPNSVCNIPALVAAYENAKEGVMVEEPKYKYECGFKISNFSTFRGLTTERDGERTMLIPLYYCVLHRAPLTNIKFKVNVGVCVRCPNFKCREISINFDKIATELRQEIMFIMPPRLVDSLMSIIPMATIEAAGYINAFDQFMSLLQSTSVETIEAGFVFPALNEKVGDKKITQFSRKLLKVFDEDTTTVQPKMPAPPRKRKSPVISSAAAAIAADDDDDDDAPAADSDLEEIVAPAPKIKRNKVPAAKKAAAYSTSDEEDEVLKEKKTTVAAAPAAKKKTVIRKTAAAAPPTMIEDDDDDDDE